MDALTNIIKGLLWGLLLCLIATLLWGCRTVKLVPVPEYHVRDSVVLRHTRDSVYLHDSVYVDVYRKGDTVYLTRDRWRTAYRDRLLRDTVTVVRRDSVPYVDTKYVEKTKEMPWYDKLFLKLGVVSAVFLLAWIAAWVMKRKI